MTEEELERIQLEIALSESLLDNNSQAKFNSSQELAYFSDLSIDDYKGGGKGSTRELKYDSSNGTAKLPSRNQPIAKTKPNPSTTSDSKSNSSSSMSKPNGSSNSATAKALSFLNSSLNALGSSVTPLVDYCVTCHEPCVSGAIINCARKELIDGQFAPRGDPAVPFHIDCAVKLFNPTCCVCSESIRDRYYKHPFFDNEVYCFSHSDIQSCFACGRKQPFASTGREKFADLNDGRSICGDCSSTIIMDTAEVQAIYAKIVDYMENWQGLVIPKGMREVPVLAVDVLSLNENIAKNNNGKGGICCGEGTVRGLTMSTLGEVRHMSGGSVAFNPRTGMLIPGRPQVVKIEQVRDVTAVLVLYGLPEELATSIIAHEAMHVWLKLSKQMPFHLPSKLEEGLCQVVSFKYLQHVGEQRATGKSDGMTEKDFHEWQQTELLRSYLCHQIESDVSPVYGDGFREALACVKALGLHVVLDYVRDNGALPSV